MLKKIQFFVLVIASGALALSSCTKSVNTADSLQSSSATFDLTENGTNPDEAIITSMHAKSFHSEDFSSFLFTESNAAAKNQILSYKINNNGSLSLMQTIASGGTGTGVGLGSQGALALNSKHDFLFAVNAGNNTVSSYKIANDGSLTLLKTVGSGGKQPISLSSHANLLYVLNGGSDNIAGFTVDAAGSLSFINGSIQSLGAMGTGAEEIAFSPNGKYIYVSEKVVNMITTFQVNSLGVAGARTSLASTGMTPFGFDFSGNEFLVISNAVGGVAGASSCTSYEGANTGDLEAVNGNVADSSAAACWLTTTAFGRFAYVSNAGSNNISSYYVSPAGKLFLVKAVAATAGVHPLDIVVAPNNFYVFNINSGSHTITGFSRDFMGRLKANGTTTGLPDFASGLVAFGHKSFFHKEDE